jgi:hypothetical protein
MEEQSKEIFEGKTISNLAKEIYEKHKEQDQALKTRINQLADMVESPGDAIVIVPMLKGYFDSSLKNDEVLMRMLQIFQKQEDKKAAADSDSSLLSEKDIAQLFEEVSSYTVSNTSTPQIAEEVEKTKE